MKAVLLSSRPGGFEIRDVPVPVIGGGEVLVEMKACGLCGTDVEKMRGEYTSAMPVIGHEAVGVVAAVGEGVERVRPGDRVFPHHHVACHDCHLCRKGDETVCAHYKTSNLDPGGFAEYIRVPRWNVAKGGVSQLPQGLTWEEGTMVEPAACCVRALDRCGVEAGDTALVVGAGPIGMMHALLLKARSAKVLLSDVAEPRLEFARAASGAKVLDARRTDVPQAVKAETGGVGADLVIVASGSDKAVGQGLEAVRKGGTVCLFGIPSEDSAIVLSLSRVYSSTVRIMSSYGADESDVAKAIGALSGKTPDLRPLVTHRLRLGDFKEGVGAMTRGEALKVVVTP